MTSVSLSGVSGGSTQQSVKLALLAKLFQTTGKAESDKTRPTPEPVAAPLPPSQVNSVAGLASMFEALQNEVSSVSNLLSRMLQAVDTDGDGRISADELLAVTEPATGQLQVGGRPATAMGDDHQSAAVSRAMNLEAGATSTEGTDAAGREASPFVASVQDPANLVQPVPNALAANSVRPPVSAYEALFQSLQVVFAQANGATATTSGQRYTDLLRSLAKAG
ncbi:MAG: hypothetical protein H7245_18835 [Candidatus Saccharibacteria bacterium]|nr:hypothetical protein [Pseudorhodobacter sp.]